AEAIGPDPETGQPGDAAPPRLGPEAEDDVQGDRPDPVDVGLLERLVPPGEPDLGRGTVSDQVRDLDDVEGVGPPAEQEAVDPPIEAIEPAAPAGGPPR